MRQILSVFLALFSLTLFLACETIHGVSSWQDRPAKLDDLSCLDRAVRMTPGIDYVDSQLNQGHAKSFWLEKDIRTRTYSVRYRVHGIERSDYTADVSVTESESEDRSVGNNFVRYANHFGRVNGRSYSNDDIGRARDAIVALNASVREQCQLKEFNPTISD